MRITMYWMAVVSGLLSSAACERNESAEEPDRESPAAERQEELRAAEKPTTQPAAPEAVRDATEDTEEDVAASADIEAAEGTDIDGEAKFTSLKGQGVKIVVNVEKAPVGEKGIHIHEKGDCSDIPGKSMGSHFAPQGDKHGLPTDPQDQIHLGDLGNIEVKSDGTGKKEITLARANLKEGDPMSLLGKALVIHQAKDQGASAQPSGASGSPIACGVIEKD